MLGFTPLQTWILGIIVIVSLTTLVLTYFWWPKSKKAEARDEEAAEKESTNMRLYTSDITRGTQHWHDLSIARESVITPELHEALTEVGWTPDVTDPSLLQLTPANEAQGATEEWSPLIAMGVQTDFIEEKRITDEQAIVPWDYVKRDHYAELEALDDMRWDLLWAQLDDKLEEQARRCDKAVNAIFPGGAQRAQRELVPA